MDIVTKKVPELTSQEYRACHSLNMRDRGLMKFALEDERRNRVDSLAIMLWEERLLGWALLTPTKWHGEMYLNKYARRHKYAAQFYVRKSYRRQGLGQTLMQEVLKHDSKPYVVPWDARSASFFADHRVATSRDRRYMINIQKREKKRRAA